MAKSSRVDFAGVESQLSIDDGENDEFLDQPMRDGRSVGGLFSSCARPLTLGQFVAVVAFVAIILIGFGAHQATQPQTNQASTTPANLPTSEALVPTTFAPSVALPDSSQCDSGCAKCGSSSSCFFGECYCHPGFTGPTCTERATTHKAGSWFFNCPNVKAGMLFDKNDETIDWTSKDKNIVPGCPHTPWTCLMMCFENEQTGIMQIPLSMWRGAQSSEAAVWAGNTGTSNRGEEHVVAFGNYDAVPLDLGHVIEVGTGPWTQFRYMWKHAHSRGRQLTAKSFTVMEPGGIGYVKNTPTCAFKDGVLRDTHGQSLGIPTVLNFAGVEHLRYRHAFDTLMVMNVVEHVQDGYMHFQNIYHAIRPGGILIFHERYFEDVVKANCVLGDNPLHPIRLRKLVLDKFLSGFETLWLNDQPTPQMLERHCNEQGYYFIGRKKKDTQLTDCCSSRE